MRTGAAALAMIQPGPQNARRARAQDHRIYERFELGDDRGSLIYGGVKTACQVVDISLGGCCLRTDTPFTVGALAPVEVALPICGMMVRVRGITQWTKLQYLVGVRFMHPDSRSKNLLASLLTCVADGSAADLVKDAIAAEVTSGAAAQLSTPALAVELPSTELPAPESASTPGDDQAPAEGLTASPAETPSCSEEQDLTPEEKDGSAVLHFLKDGSQRAGVVASLSLEGCSVRTPEPFPAGVHLRVEVEFRTRGLRFRLGGVTEQVHDKQTVDIRFLHLSRHKLEQLSQVLDEAGDWKQTSISDNVSS